MWASMWLLDYPVGKNTWFIALQGMTRGRSPEVEGDAIRNARFPSEAHIITTGY